MDGREAEGLLLAGCVVMTGRCERLFRASQSARMCFHLMRSFEEVQDGIDAWRDTVGRSVAREEGEEAVDGLDGS